MQIARILAPMVSLPSDDVAVRAAIAVAKLFGAHVEAFSVQPNPGEAIPLFGVPLLLETMQTILDAESRYAKAAVETARAAVQAICRAERIDFAEACMHGTEPTCSFRWSWGSITAAVAAEAALCDLVVLGPVHGRSVPDINGAFLNVLLPVRRPILVAKTSPARSFRKIAIGWDGGQNAASAVRAALPFLSRAEHTDVIVIRKNPEAVVSVDDLAAYLSRAGVAHAMKFVTAEGHAIGDRLLRSAEECDADLAVIGGYGHGPLHEALFGGVTETFLDRAAMPVLLTH